MFSVNCYSLNGFFIKVVKRAPKTAHVSHVSSSSELKVRLKQIERLGLLREGWEGLLKPLTTPDSPTASSLPPLCALVLGMWKIRKWKEEDENRCHEQ